MFQKSALKKLLTAVWGCAIIKMSLAGAGVHNMMIEARNRISTEADGNPFLPLRGFFGKVGNAEDTFLKWGNVSGSAVQINFCRQTAAELSPFSLF